MSDQTETIPSEHAAEHRFRRSSRDRLMDLVGELVQTRDQFLKLAQEDGESRYAGPISQLNRVTSDFQHALRETRFQPIGQLWAPFPKMVRELSRITGKQIELTLQGGEVLLELPVLHALQEPLTHLIRNACDHGVEHPDIRQAAGKPEFGCLKLEARQESGQIVLCVSDDGVGFTKPNETKRDLASAENDPLPSGQDTGLAIVRKAVEQLGGSLELTTEPGRGATVSLSIPTAATHGMVPRSQVSESHAQSRRWLLFHSMNGKLHAIPAAEVTRLEEVPVSQLERTENGLVMRFQNNLLPLFPLSEKSNSPGTKETQPVVVCAATTPAVGLIAQEVFRIIEEPLTIPSPSQRPGILGSITSAGKLIEVLDLDHYRRQWPTAATRESSQLERKAVLCMDVSPFYRQLCRAVLEADGYRVITAESPARGMELIEDGQRLDAVLCGIELLEQNGCEFAAWFRGRSPDAQIPLVALTTFDVEEQGFRILASGFDRVLVKLDPQELRCTLQELCQQRDPSSRRCA